MKGIVFTEFVEFAAAELPPEVGRRLALSEGRYAATGNYDHGELMTLVAEAAAAAGEPQARLLERFGAHLFGYFARVYPVFFYEMDSALDFMGSIETYVHGEVLKIYPDAQFPAFECRRPGPDRLEMRYRSPRGLADLAEGLIRGCIAHFGESIDVQREDLPGPPGSAAQFVLVARGDPPAV